MREMRRYKQLIPKEESIEILKDSTSGVLALMSKEGYPYAVPLSYVYDNDKIFFHCANEGQKIDAVKNCGKASFCVVANDEVIPEKFTTAYKSVIVFGSIEIIKDEKEKRYAIETLADKYGLEFQDKGREEIEEAFSKLCMLKMSIENITGKEGLELKKLRESKS